MRWPNPVKARRISKAEARQSLECLGRAYLNGVRSGGSGAFVASAVGQVVMALKRVVNCGAHASPWLSLDYNSQSMPT